VRRLAEARRVDVAAAREQNGVETAHEPLERRLGELGRQEHRHAARLLHGVEVRGIDIGALGRLIYGDRRGDAHQRFARHAAMLPSRPQDYNFLIHRAIRRRGISLVPLLHMVNGATRDHRRCIDADYFQDYY
jgi:hypothetical protein